MDFQRLHECLRGDFALLRAAAEASDAKAAVPSCPGWTATDLVRHVVEVYLHKVECIRLGRFPQPWPPEQQDPDPFAALDEAFAALEAQFAAHDPADHAATWHEPDQTVGFWIRRMAQETVIHRIDAELTAGRAVTPVPADLALDGIDELLQLFLAYASVAWLDQISELLAAADERPVLVHATATGSDPAKSDVPTASARWLLSAHPTGIVAREITGDAASEAAAQQAALSVTGTPDAVLRWLWNRQENSPAADVSGDPLLLAQFHALKVALTQ